MCDDGHTEHRASRYSSDSQTSCCSSDDQQSWSNSYRRASVSGKTRANQVFFPTYGMSVQTLLEIEELEPHEACVAKHTVVEVPEDAAIIFVSHQWLGFAELDPSGVQLRALQQMLNKLVVERGVAELFDADEWDAFAKGVDKRKVQSAHADALLAMQKSLTPDSFCEDLSRAFVRLDFLSVPQLLVSPTRASRTGIDCQPSSQAAAAQLRAIKTIPYYIERASYFVVVAPRTIHADTGEVCDLESWRGRGWCRLEEAANFLSLQTLNPLVLTERPKLAVEEFADFWTFRANTRLGSVGCGAFTCERDRPLCARILKAMLYAKLEHLAEQEQRLMSTLFGVAEAKLLATSADGPLCVFDAEGQPASWASVATDSRFGSLEGGGQEHPIGAPTVAAMLGDVRVLRELFVERGADVGTLHKATGATTIMHAAGAGDVGAVELLLQVSQAQGKPSLIDRGTSRLGITPLDRATRCGHADVVMVLLRSGASVSVTRSDGTTPLHAAADMGREQCARLLVRAGAPLDVPDNNGATPLHLCACGFTLFGSQPGRRAVAELLLGAGADASVRDSLGRTAHDVAIADSNVEVAMLLERHAACRITVGEQRGPRASAGHDRTDGAEEVAAGLEVSTVRVDVPRGRSASPTLEDSCARRTCCSLC